ncbi:MAG: DUF4127 family protein [Acidaminococcaceae bacterium]|nr:DUF4127 family protein [Acidaminococcaceae bacterium]
MRSLRTVILAVSIICLLPFVSEAKEKILFIPVDDRPVCFSYTVNTLKAAGWDIQTPPKEYIASYNRTGNPDKLYKWLEDNALLATDAVVSSDSLIYGGLVPSRTHNLNPEVLSYRIQRLLDFKKKFKYIRLYVFGTVMRSPRASHAPEEPAYYSRYGADIFQMGALKDKQEMGVINSKEKKQLEMLLKVIPQEVQADLYTRRKANLNVTKNLLLGVKEESFDYFLLGKDDTAVYSDAHRDARKIDEEMKDLPDWKIKFFAGADQLGLILLTRAVNKIEQTTPLVYTFYNEGVGPDTVPTYEDVIVKKTLRGHIIAAGGYPATLSKNADLILAVNTPTDGKCLSATSLSNTDELTKAKSNFIRKVEKFVMQGKNVSIGDIAYSNGADNGLVTALFATNMKTQAKKAETEHKLAWSLGAYAGWNTASNTLGYAIGQGIMRQYLTDTQKNNLLTVRYLDDWAYEAHVRQDVRQNLVYKNQWTDGALTPSQRTEAEQAISKGIVAFSSKYMTPYELNKWKYSLPWSRMFEVNVYKNNYIRQNKED